MKKTLSMLLACIFLLAFALTSASAESWAVDESLGGTITIWDWDGSGNRLLAKEFNKYYPNVTVDVVDVAWADYMEKLQSSLVSGLDVPDILLGESNWRGEMFAMGICENLEAEPYNLQRGDMVDSSVPLMSDQSGNVVGVEMQVATAGFAYKRSLAKELLGTDDPDEIAAMISTWEDFKALGKEILTKSDGRVKMMPSLGDVLLVSTNQTACSFIDGTTVDITKRMKAAIDNTIEMRDAGIIGTEEISSASWYAAYASSDYLFYECPSWCASLVIPKNAEETAGDWAVTKGPGASFTVGGTSLSIYAGSENKDAAWAFLKFAYFSDLGGNIMYTQIGNYTCYKPYYSSDYKPYEIEGPYDAFFGGQSLIRFYTTILTANAPDAGKTKYDSMIDTTLRKLSTTYMKDTGINAAQALQMFIDEIQMNDLDANVK